MSSFSPEYDHLFKILIVGDEGVGKTSLLYRFGDDTYTDSAGASLFHYTDHKIRTIDLDGKTIKLQVWDCPKPSGSFDNKKWMSNVDAYIVTFDLSNRESFESIKTEWKCALDRHGKSGASIMIVDCKADIGERAVSYEEVRAYCKANSLSYMETSAKTGANVENAFNNLAIKCLVEEQLRRPAVTRVDVRETVPNPAKIKRDFIAELDTRIEVLRSEIGQLLSANKDLKRQKMEALGDLKAQLLVTIRPVSQVIHEFRAAHPFLDEGKHSHRTKDLLDKYDTKGPASK